MAKSLKDISDSEKAKAFDMIITAYGKDGDISKFGHDVQDIIKFLREYHC